MIDLRQGDCLEVMLDLEPESVDAIVTDPPAGISFMGKNWDEDKGGRQQWIAWMQEVAAECLRIIKPGGYALVWAIPRTSHWTGIAWENAGWQPRDKIYHAFGSGFPKSLNISVALDRMAGMEREVVGKIKQPATAKAGAFNCSFDQSMAVITATATEAAKQWDGWGTALKPSIEEWWLFRKPLIGTVAENILKHGTGGINIDGCRVGIEGATKRSEQSPYPKKENGKEDRSGSWARTGHEIEHINAGRFPANLIHDNSPEVVGCFPESNGMAGGGIRKKKFKIMQSIQVKGESNNQHLCRNDSGSAARFFKSCPYTTEDIAEYKRIAYFAKASKRDRDKGCEGLDKVPAGGMQGRNDGSMGSVTLSKNFHPTVKPTALMRYLCKLITPPGGTILDPFMGSGSTGKAAHREDFSFIGIEKEPEYFEIAKARIAAAKRNLQYELFDMEDLQCTSD
jgi:DNA modification methylase